jgi:uncharacterized protein YsxB (DUF464 family)
MITVHVRRRTSGDVEQITINGHAGYADPGQDIVCAAVSGISLGMINAIEIQLGIALPVKQGKDGFLQITAPVLDSDMHLKLQLILDVMISSLQSVALEYGKFVKITDTQKKRRWASC